MPSRPLPNYESEGESDDGLPDRPEEKRRKAQTQTIWVEVQFDPKTKTAKDIIKDEKRSGIPQNGLNLSLFH